MGIIHAIVKFGHFSLIRRHSFQYFNIDLIEVKAIRELLNDAFDRFCLDFGFSSPKKNVSFSRDSTSDF